MTAPGPSSLPLSPEYAAQADELRRLLNKEASAASPTGPLPISVCRTSYTPQELVALLIRHFILNDAPLGIGPDLRPAYPITSGTKEATMGGCAAYTIAAAVAPQFLQAMNEVKTHANCLVKDLSEKKNIPVDTIVSAPDWTKTQRALFIQQLQKAHDDAVDTATFNGSRQPTSHSMAQAKSQLFDTLFDLVPYGTRAKTLALAAS